MRGVEGLHCENDTGWKFEVVNDQNKSTIWDGDSTTDKEALDFAAEDIKAEGIEVFNARPLNQYLH